MTSKMDCLVPAVDFGRLHNTCNSVSRDIQWLSNLVGPIVVVIVDSVPILLLIIKSAQEYSLFARDSAYKNACMLKQKEIVTSV